MTRYRRVETGTWNDARFRELSRPEPNGQTLWMYLLCGQRTTIFPGLITATLAVVADDLRWPLERTRSVWDEVADRDMAEADFAAGVIVLPKALLDSRGNPRETAKPHSPNSFRGWAKAWPDVPECGLKDRYLDALARFAKALGKPYVKAYEEAFGTHRGRVEDASELQREPARVPVPVPDPAPVLRSGSGSSTPAQSPPAGPPGDRDPARAPAPERVVRPVAHDPADPLIVRPHADTVRLARLVARFRDAMRDARRAVAEKHGIAGVRYELTLHGGVNETDLRQRLKDAGDRAEADLEHVIAVATAEALASGSVEWLGWNLGRERSWDRALRTTPKLAVKQPPGERRSVFDVVDDAVAKLEQEVDHERS